MVQMPIKDFIALLKKCDKDAKVVIWDWDLKLTPTTDYTHIKFTIIEDKNETENI